MTHDHSPASSVQRGEGADHGQEQFAIDLEELKLHLEPHRLLFEIYRGRYTAALEAVVNSGLQQESQNEEGRLTAGAWRIGVGHVETTPGEAELAPYAAYVKIRGTVIDMQPTGSVDFDRPLIVGAFDRPRSAQTTRETTRGDQEPPYMMVDTVVKARMPLVRSDLKLDTHHHFERVVTEPDGSTTTTQFLAEQHATTESFPSYSDTLFDPLPDRVKSRPASDFDLLVEGAIESARPIVAKTVWETQFADAFSAGRELPGVPKSSPEFCSDDSEHDNPLRIIARYAGAGMLAELDTGMVVDTFMSPDLRTWAADVQSVETDIFEDQDATRNRAQWAADYAEAFRQEVNQQLGKAYALIGEYVAQRVTSFYEIAEKAEAFADDLLRGALVGHDYQGTVWTRVSGPAQRFLPNSLKK